MTITTITINAVDYVAYASVAEADAYLAVDPLRAAAWALLTVDQKGANLVAGTRRLDLLPWSGTKTDDAQTTEWPRDGAECDGVAVPDGTLPTQIEQGAILTAGSIAIDPTAASAGSSGSNIKRAKAGSAEVEFFRPQAGVPFQDVTAYALFECLLDQEVVGGVGYGFATGNCDTTAFNDRKAPRLDEGFG